MHEITVACYALQHEVCFNCKCRNALRWNGGSSTFWQDLVCIASGCMYEVKTKADMQKVDNSFRYHKGTGCQVVPFLDFCQLRNSNRPDQNMFLVLLPRKPCVNLNREEFYPVQIVEIASVLPRVVNPTTFNPHISSPMISSLELQRRWKKYA